MKLTVLIDNNTLIDRYFLSEPGVSFLINDGSTQVLFDVGYSDTFIQNAQKMNINLLQSNYLVLSHGHLDHTWGLDPLLKKFTEAAIESTPFKRPKLVAHPDVFHSKTLQGINEIGCIIPESKLKRHFDIHLSKEPVWLSNKLVFLGEIERTNNFENKEPLGEVHVDGKSQPDYIIDDTALAYKGENGLTIITGCSHSGICNIIEQAKRICNEDRIVDVIGGFHLLQPSKKQLENTLEYFRKLNPLEIHPCHCVDLNSKIALSKATNIKEVGVGLLIEHC